MRRVVAHGLTGLTRQVSRSGINGRTPGEVCNDVIVIHDPSPILIEIVATSSPCGLSGNMEIAKKRQYTSSGLSGNIQKLNSFVDGNLTNNLDYASIFSKVSSHKLSDSYSGDVNLRFSMNFASDVVQTQATHFTDLGLPAINTLNERCVLGTPTTRIFRPMDGSHWNATDNIFGESVAVRMSVARQTMTITTKNILKF